MINYTITVQNTGNVTLTGVTVTDPFADAVPGIVRGADVVGDNDGLLEVGETWGYTAKHTVTQAEIDAGGNFDGPDAGSAFDQLRNVATADSDQTGEDTDDASVPVAQNPSLNIDKSVSSVTGGTGGAANSDGDVINYTITVQNTGNVTLTGVTVTDPFADAVPGIVRGARRGRRQRRAARGWRDLGLHGEAHGDPGGDRRGRQLRRAGRRLGVRPAAQRGDGGLDQTGEDTDDASVPVAENPSLNIDKSVSSVTGGTGGAADSDGDVINYTITVQNTGNVTLTGVTVTVRSPMRFPASCAVPTWSATTTGCSRSARPGATRRSTR